MSVAARHLRPSSMPPHCAMLAILYALSSCCAKSSATCGKYARVQGVLRVTVYVRHRAAVEVGACWCSHAFNFFDITFVNAGIVPQKVECKMACVVMQSRRLV